MKKINDKKENRDVENEERICKEQIQDLPGIKYKIKHGQKDHDSWLTT